VQWVESLVLRRRVQEVADRRRELRAVRSCVLQGQRHAFVHGRGLHVDVRERVSPLFDRKHRVRDEHVGERVSVRKLHDQLHGEREERDRDLVRVEPVHLYFVQHWLLRL
jgi:hypothetical protein